jgi:ATP-binding cassette, subfamily C, bacterial CydD
VAGGPDRRLLRRARATRTYLAVGVAIGTVSAVVVIAQAWLVAHAIGGVFATRTVAPALAVVAPLIMVIAARAALAWLHTVIGARTSAAVKSQLRKDILSARLTAPERIDVGSGTLVSLLTEGLDGLDGYFARYLPQLVLACTVPLVILVAIVSMDVISAVTVAVTLPLIPVFMILVGLATKARMDRRWRVQGRLAHHFADLVSGLPTLQVFGRARAQAEGLRRTEQANRTETMATLRVSFLSSLVLELVATLSVALVAVGVGLRVVDGHLDLTTALFVLILAPEAYLPLRQVGTHYHDSVDGISAAERAFAIIDRAGTQAVRNRPVPDLPVPDLSVATIELVDVGLRIGARWVVRHVDLVLGPGEFLTLAGPSGAGKTTLLKAVMGGIEPDEGQILVGGVPLADLDLTQWRARLAWVAQQPALISGSILDNVVLGAPDAPRTRVRAALTAAGASGLGSPVRCCGSTAAAASCWSWMNRLPGWMLPPSSPRSRVCAGWASARWWCPTVRR